MRSAQQNLRDFHRKFGLTINDTPTVPDDQVLQFRINLINEEAEEFAQAAKTRNLVEMADALADLVYVTLGAAVSLGIDLAPIFKEVHRSNMTKVWPDGQVHRRADGKVIKPPTYSPANIAGELQRQTSRAERRTRSRTAAR
jgi:predicted HAD superfamily Cof-like phosphohydrolase